VGWAVNLAVMSNWFPKRGRGLLIGCWASNANVGDIIGAQIYKAATNTTDLMWGTGIIIVGSLVIVVGILNLLFLIEFPWEKGIVINEESHILQLKTEEIKQEALPLINHEDIQPISFFKALMIPGVIVFSLSFFFIKFS
jgi:sugar phosphate permease